MIKQRYIFWDLDGVLTGWPGFAAPNYGDVSRFYTILEELKNRGIKHSLVTNRPACQILPIIFNLDCYDSLHITESGCSLLEPFPFRQHINPKYNIYISTIRPKILEYLRLNYFKKSKLEELPGSIVKIEAVGRSKIKNDLFPIESFPASEIRASKIIEIVPKMSNKLNGLTYFVSMTKRIFNEDIDWKNSLFIADSSADIDLAVELHKRRGLVAAVGNSDADYKRLVKNLKGILAPKNTAYYGSVNYILTNFFALKS